MSYKTKISDVKLNESVVTDCDDWYAGIKSSAQTFTGKITAAGGIVGDLNGNVTGHASLDLPLTGGMMSGGIGFSASNFNNASTSEIMIGSGSSYNKDGACLSLRSKSYQTDISKNGFALLCPSISNDGTTTDLVGRSDGTLLWTGPTVKGNGFASAGMPNMINGSVSVSLDSSHNVVFPGGATTAPSAGWIEYDFLITGANAYVYILTNGLAVDKRQGHTVGYQLSACIPINKDAVVNLLNGDCVASYIKFISCMASI